VILIFPNQPIHLLQDGLVVESKTKTDFPSDLIRAIIKDHFGTSVRIDAVLALEDGWFNTAYEVRFANHKPDAVLRIAPPLEMRLLTYEAEMMSKELLVNQALQDMPDIPIPRILGWNFERNLINRDYMFVEKLSGIPFNKIENELTLAEKAAIHMQLGEIVRKIYSYKGKTWGYFGNGLGSNARTWREAFSNFVFAILADGEDLGVELPMPYDEIRALFDQHAHALEDIRDPVLVHWDLWPGNVFILRKEGKPVIEGIIDWERAFWGDPESEPSIAISHYGAEFFLGYGSSLSEGVPAETRRCMYVVYLLLVMAIEAKVRFETADHLGWVKQELTAQLQLLGKF